MQHKNAVSGSALKLSSLNYSRALPTLCNLMRVWLFQTHLLQVNPGLFCFSIVSPSQVWVTCRQLRSKANCFQRSRKVTVNRYQCCMWWIQYFAPFLHSLGVFGETEPSCECLCEINAQWSPNRRTQLFVSPTAKQNGFLACRLGFLWWDRQGASDPLQSIPHTAMFQCWEKESVRKYHRLEKGTCPQGHLFLAWVEDVPTLLSLCENPIRCCHSSS